MNSHRDDPFTSDLAGRAIEASGAAESQRLRCLDMVRLHPGCTSAELAVAMGIERHIPARRLSELAVHGLIVRGPARHCDVGGALAITWLPVAPMPKAQEIVQPQARVEPQRTVQKMMFDVAKGPHWH